jgi:HEAT repeat protein
MQDDPDYIKPLLEMLGKREAEFTGRSFGQGLGTLAYLARNEEKKDQVRDFLESHINSKKRSVQMASINGLGTLGDVRAIPVLQTFANSSKENRERSAAERAVTDLRSGRKPVDDFKNLRQEVLDLQKANRELRKDLDEIKKSLDSKSTPPATSLTKTKKAAVSSPKSS